MLNSTVNGDYEILRIRDEQPVSVSDARFLRLRVGR